jgi:hypothetical protein
MLDRDASGRTRALSAMHAVLGTSPNVGSVGSHGNVDSVQSCSRRCVTGRESSAINFRVCADSGCRPLGSLVDAVTSVISSTPWSMFEFLGALGKGAGDEEADAARVACDDCADFKQLGARCSFAHGQLGADETDVVQRSMST